MSRMANTASNLISHNAHRTNLPNRNAWTVCRSLPRASANDPVLRLPRKATSRDGVKAGLVVWVDAQLRRHGVARQLVDAAARHTGFTPSGLAWAEPFTDSGYLLAQSIAPDGLWIADYS